MSLYQAPAKLNLALLVSPPAAGGLHPLESLVQTIDWLDLLEVEEADEDALTVDGAEIEPEENFVTRALVALREQWTVPPLAIRLEKRIPEEAGLGGGSSDAAATLLAAIDIGRVPADTATATAPSIGSDVSLFLTGGTVMISGFGEIVEPEPSLDGFAVAVVVPEYRLRTADVYRRWDEMEGPVGETIASGLLPPRLRDGIPIRNDLTPAAIDLEPALADFMADLRSRWGTVVAMTGSGSACFGFFPDVGEAEDAAQSVASQCRGTIGATLRPRGVERVD
jgi:4-diphosphocytidyl-2-C-methyl-D-erythritol kinase